MPGKEIRSLFNGRPVNPKINLKPNLSREKTRKAVLRVDVKTAREMTQANMANARQSPQVLGRKATKILQEFRAGKIDVII